MATAALIIIGSEILSGKFADENAPYLIGRLRQLGVDLGRIVTIPDDMPVMIDELRRCSRDFDHVFTTGGVGPTHDDLTFPAVAAAFEVPLVRHPVLARVLEEKLGDRLNEAAYRMAEVPQGVDLWWDGNVIYPLVVMRNICIFPGVPALVKLKFEAVAARFAGVPVSSLRITTHRTEPEIADQLSEAAGMFPQVAIGSYPRFEVHPNVVIVTMEGRDDDAVEACEAWLSDRIR